MIRMHVAGMTPKGIAEILGCTPQNVSDVINSPLAKPYIMALRERADEATATAQAVIAENGHTIASKLTTVAIDGTLDGEPVQLRERLMVMRDMLDRGPAPKVSNIKGLIGHFPVDDDMLRRIRERAKASQQEALARGDIVEAEIVASEGA
jgi:hypothetical protein